MFRLRIFFVLLVLSLLAPLAVAEDKQSVKVFTVKPSNRPPAILAASAWVPESPNPIDPATKKSILIGIGGRDDIPTAPDIKAAPESELGHIVLTAQKPYFKEQGYLRLTLPYSFHPEASIEFNKDFPSILDVKLNVKEDGLYLVDISVKAVGAGTYNVQTESGGQTFDDSSGKLEHVLIALNAAASGWTSLQMKREGTGYQLYSVEVTKAN